MKKRIYSRPYQPSDDVFDEFTRLVELKRQGRFYEADAGYAALYEQEKEEIRNLAYVLKSWAKVKLCLGEYEIFIQFMHKAANLFQTIHLVYEVWQCLDQAKTVENRFTNPEDFIDYVRAASGGALKYPPNYF